ncbi:MAG: protoheme IX farnesyltransferase [Rhodospirillaceae bacterium]|nr:MAG: protoheme IX farnesyltransferase [Rhodospirillaceae bacterium]
MQLRSYLELMKLRIGFLIAVTAMAGYAAIAHHVDAGKLAFLFLAMLLGSSGSAVFNQFYDRDIDRLMPRTAKRPLAAGMMVDPRNALWFAGGLLITGALIAVLAFNWVVAIHLLLGAFVYGIVYTVWLKRRHWTNIIIGGAAGSFAVLGGAAAVDPHIWLLPTLMAITLFLWTPSHFWSLAILIKDGYIAAGVPMLPVVVGDKACARWIFGNTVLLVISALLPVLFGLLGPIYAVISLGFGLRFLWLNWLLVKDPSHVLARRNFLFSMQYLAGVFLAIVIDRHLSLSALGL